MRTLAQFQGSEMSPGLYQDFMVFVPGVTQGNEDVSSVQEFISLFWCEAGELGGRESPRFTYLHNIHQIDGETRHHLTQPKPAHTHPTLL